MIATVAREAGSRWALGLAVALGVSGLLLTGVVLELPFLDRGVPGSWLVASTLTLLAWYVMRPRWQREIARLPRAPRHRALVALFAATLVGIGTTPMVLAGIPRYELTLYPALFSMAVLGAVLAGNLGWMPILVFSILAETLNNLSLNTLSFWVSAHHQEVEAVGTVLLGVLVAVYVLRGPLFGHPSADE